MNKQQWKTEADNMKLQDIQGLTTMVKERMDEREWGGDMNKKIK